MREGLYEYSTPWPKEVQEDDHGPNEQGQQDVRMNDVTRRRRHHAPLQSDCQEASQQCLPGHRPTGLVMEILKNIAFFIGTVVFFHN